MKINKLLSLSLIVAGGILAQSVETIPFRAILLPSNEVPPIDIAASGTATIWLHVVRNASGQIVSGSADFDVSYSFPGAVRFTGLHIHKAPAGVNGDVTINTGISAASPIDDAVGRGTIKRQAPVTSEVALDTARGMLENPAGFYVNLHSAVNPGGVIRGQLQRAQMVVLMGLMNPRNEVPPIDSNASAIGTVVALATRDSSGRLTSGLVIFDANYTGFAPDQNLTGFHIHAGRAGANAGVTINTGLANLPPSATGAGNLHYEVEVPMTNANSVATLEGLFSRPQDYYVNIHNAANLGGLTRAQLRNTDRMDFPVTLLTSNEVPPTTVDARAEGLMSVHTLRNSDGTIAAGTVIFDINPRFPGETSFTGLHIHNGAAGSNGGVTVDSGLRSDAPVVTATGSMNLYRIVTVSSAAGLATLNSLVMNPELHYVNLHTTVNTGGAVRTQLSQASTAVPNVSAVISSVSDGNLRLVAPGGLMTIFGTNLTKVGGDSGGVEAPTVSTSLNGVRVSIAGRDAPILILQPGFIVAQVPVETAAGTHPLIVTTANGSSTGGQVMVASTAPALYADATGGIVVKNNTFQLVRPDNPAQAGEILVIYATGLGAPAGLATGRTVAADALLSTSPVTVTIGGRNADVLYSLASPGYVGLYQIAVRLPAGLTAGNVPVVVRMGAVMSNSVNIAVR